jgi:hypothetical protein
VTHPRSRRLAIKRAKPGPADIRLAAIETLLDTRPPASFQDLPYLLPAAKVRMRS